MRDELSFPGPWLPAADDRPPEADGCVDVRLAELCELAPSLAACAESLRAFAERLDALHAAGWQLGEPVLRDTLWLLEPGADPVAWRNQNMADEALRDGLRAHAREQAGETP